MKGRCHWRPSHHQRRPSPLCHSMRQGIYVSRLRYLHRSCDEVRPVVDGSWRRATAPDATQRGTLDAYHEYRSLIAQIGEVCAARKVRCDVELTPELVGL